MSVSELERISYEMENVGYSMTTFNALGAFFDQTSADELCGLVNDSEGSETALQVVEHIVKNDMTIVQDARCLEIGKALIKPAVDILFAGNLAYDESWALFGLNRYRQGGKFGAHQDNVGKTVLVVTVSGEREFSIFDTPEPGLPDGTPFESVESVFQAIPGSIILLDPVKDPAHAVTATPSPSIVAVADIPHTLRQLQ